MRKFFVDENNIKDDKIYIEGQDRKHIVDVLRLNEGDEIVASSEGINYFSEIAEIDNDRVVLSVREVVKGSNEPNIDIYLFQGLAKGEKMDFIVQKCTEIGVKSFYGVEMNRSVVRAKNEKWINGRIDRFNKISEEASKQCKRDYIPKFNDIIKFDDMIKLLEEESNVLVPYESEKDNDIKTVLANISEDTRINIVIGPEGGFSDEEILKLKNIGAKTVSLSNRIFRTETAGLVTSVITLYELGNMGVI